MPTGYTCKVQSGEVTDYREFLWDIAHMFGGFNCVSSDFKIDSDAEKHIGMSPYYENHIEQLQKELEMYKTITDEELQKQIEDMYNKNLEDNQKTRERYALNRKRYEYMLRDVHNWIPPTKEHENIKKEAIRQLNDSIDSDCCEDYIKEPTMYDAKSYRKDMIETLVERIARAYSDYSDQLKAHKNRIEWMKALQDSLK